MFNYKKEFKEIYDKYVYKKAMAEFFNYVENDLRKIIKSDNVFLLKDLELNSNRNEETDFDILFREQMYVILNKFLKENLVENLLIKDFENKYKDFRYNVVLNKRQKVYVYKGYERILKIEMIERQLDIQ